MREFAKKMVVIAKNEAKYQFHCYKIKVRELSNIIKNEVSFEHYQIIQNATETSKEKQFVKKKNHLIKKFKKLHNEAVKEKTVEKRTSFLKSAVLNLTNDELPEHHKSLLNLGPKFVPSTKKIPYMDIITSTELCASNLERQDQRAESESLRQEVSDILLKNFNIKTTDNLTKNERIAIKEIKNNTDIKIYPFDKENGFTIINDADAISKIEEQLGKANVINYDPTQSFTRKIQNLLSKLRKEDKFTNRLYFDLYPSDPIPPRLYGAIKAHKPEKNFPMRTIVSTIGTPPYGISKYLVELVQPTLNKNIHRVVNSSSFVNEAKTWIIDPTEIQVSYDVVNLYPSVPLDKAIGVLLDQLKEDYDDLKLRTKLSLVDIHQMLELCLSECYFLWQNQIWQLTNSGPIGLSIMVVISESYLQHLEKQAITQAFTKNTAPKSFKRYVDDSHARFNTIGESNKFHEILNQQDPAIQYTIEIEDANKMLNFLDVSIINNQNSTYEFKIYRKPAITNVQIKPNSCINPSIVNGVFKGFLSRASRICSEKHLPEEVEFLIDIFVENGHDRQQLQELSKDYLSKISVPKPDKNENENIVKLPWIPVLGPKLRKAFRKKGIKTIFTSGSNLKQILCNNKSALTPHSHPGVYELECSCNSIYIGETKKKVLTRTIEHQQDSMQGKWSSSGATEHSKSCHGHFNWLHPKTLKIENRYFPRKMREALEIKKAKYSTSKKVLNRDEGQNIKTTTWEPILKKIEENEQH